MKKEEDILETKENEMPQKPFFWIRRLKGYRKCCFCSMMTLDAGVLLLTVCFFTGIELNIPLTYLIVDAFLLWWWDREEKKRYAMELEYAGDRTEIILQKIEELRIIEEEVKEEQRLEAERQAREQAEKLAKKEAKKQARMEKRLARHRR